MNPSNRHAHRAQRMLWKAQQIGAVAAEILSMYSTGEILAVFERSVYLRMFPSDLHQHDKSHSPTTGGFDADNALLCISHCSLGAGPLQISIIDQWQQPFVARDALEVGANINVSSNGLTVHHRNVNDDDADARTTLDFTGVPIVNARASIMRCADSQGALRELTRSKRVVVGAAPGLDDGLVANRSAAILTQLHGWLAQTTPGGTASQDRSQCSPLPKKISDLIGLGLGLTPAGDDYLAGVLLGLRYCRRDEAASALTDFLGIHARQRTNRISRAHLACLQAGWYQDVVVELLSTLNGTLNVADQDRSQRLDDVVGRLIDVGHTSGTDFLGGFTATLNCSK